MGCFEWLDRRAKTPRAVHAGRTFPRRWTALVVCAVWAASSCGAEDGTVDPSVLLSVNDVRDITGMQELENDPAAPTDRAQPDPTAPGPCKAIFDQQVAFGSSVSDFRTVSYGAATHTAPGEIRGVAIVSQAVGSYADADEARAAFNRLEPMVRQCSFLDVEGYRYDIVTPSDSTLTLTSAPGDIVYHVASTSLISVVVVGLPESEHVAEEIVQSISQRLL
jgi:hypothetical protein